MKVVENSNSEWKTRISLALTLRYLSVAPKDREEFLERVRKQSAEEFGGVSEEDYIKERSNEKNKSNYRRFTKR